MTTVKLETILRSLHFFQDLLWVLFDLHSVWVNIHILTVTKLDTQNE